MVEIMEILSSYHMPELHRWSIRDGQWVSLQRRICPIIHDLYWINHKVPSVSRFLSIIVWVCFYWRRESRLLPWNALSIKNAISNLEKRNCISVKALLMIHTVLRICPSSVFSMHSFSFLKVTFFLTGQFSFSPFRKNHVAFSVWRPFVFIPVVCCLRITIVADKNVIFLFVITISFFFMFSCSIEIWNDSLTLKTQKRKELCSFNSPFRWKKGN